ncbi:HAD family hydrolase [Winogradskyella flava]|uniref:HAD family hydrolase n=1 Tax=Winogradskyella flava TaxID=1884876 RepID=UPI0024938596|nr:HAD hydrolase-like protein [Winogradskyella flava]
MNQLLIFDLDDTLFETKSISKTSVKPIFDQFERLLINNYGKEMTENIVSELWKFPFDFVAQKYLFDNTLNSEFARLVNQYEYQLNIKTFEDFGIVQNLRQEKILVTTGFLKLQNAKIRDLGIEKDFTEIYIDDLLDPKRIYKQGIFKNILLKKNINPNLIYVIGDNPNSELKAGFELNLNTVQVSKYGQEKSEYAHYCITDFNELKTILK